MRLKSRWLIIAGAALLTGVLTAAAAFAFGGGDPKAAADRLQTAVQSGKITQAQADVAAQLAELRRAALTKLQADEKAVIDQAAQSGKLTQEQADQLRKRGPGGRPGFFGAKGHGKGPMGPKGPMGHKRESITPEQLKAKLDAAVQSGKLTQEQADKMLQKWTERGARHKNQAPPQS